MLAYKTKLGKLFSGDCLTIVAEKMNRNWIGIELNSCDSIINRFNENLKFHKNTDILKW